MQLVQNLKPALTEISQQNDILKQLHKKEQTKPVSSLQRFENRHQKTVRGQVVATGDYSELYEQSYVVFRDEKQQMHYAVTQHRVAGKLTEGQSIEVRPGSAKSVESKITLSKSMSAGLELDK